MSVIWQKKLVIFIWSLSLLSFGSYYFFFNKHLAKKYFSDKKVIALCNAAKYNKIKKMDKLLNEGVNINTIGNNNFTPVSWLLYNNKHTNKTREGFKYLLQKGANVNIKFKTTNNYLTSVVKYTVDSIHMDNNPEYLEILLNYSNLKITELEYSRLMKDTIIFDLYQHFKIFLENSRYTELEKKQKNSLMSTAIKNSKWKYVYLFLQHGADYKIVVDKKLGNELNNNLVIVRELENKQYYPSSEIINSFGDGIDYRQKVVQFLREKRMEVNPWMPENEKYISKNGKSILYIKENGRFVELINSKEYSDEKHNSSTIVSSVLFIPKFITAFIIASIMAPPIGIMFVAIGIFIVYSIKIFFINNKNKKD